MPDPKIDITGVDSNGKLILSDRGHTEVYSSEDFRKITWKVKDRTNTVISIKLSAITTPAYPFEDSIPPGFGGKVELKVVKNYPYLDWQYCIVWKDKQGIEHKNDPIISIRPSNSSSHFLNSIVQVVMIALGIIVASLLFWKLRKK